MTKWEYLQVDIGHGDGDIDYETARPIVALCSAQVGDLYPVPTELKKQGVKKVFVYLGNEGWEMCGTTTIELYPNAKPHPQAPPKEIRHFMTYFYFKRPIDPSI